MRGVFSMDTPRSSSLAFLSPFPLPFTKLFHGFHVFLFFAGCLSADSVAPGSSISSAFTFLEFCITTQQPIVHRFCRKRQLGFHRAMKSVRFSAAASVESSPRFLMCVFVCDLISSTRILGFYLFGPSFCGAEARRLSIWIDGRLRVWFGWVSNISDFQPSLSLQGLIRTRCSPKNLRFDAFLLCDCLFVILNLALYLKVGMRITFLYTLILTDYESIRYGWGLVSELLINAIEKEAFERIRIYFL